MNTHDWLDIVLLLSIPVISGLVGYGTNVLALKMTFYPLKFFGIPPFFGWQGIVPAKARKMAEKSVDMLTTRLVNVEEEFGKLEPARVAEMIMPDLKNTTDQIIGEAMEAQFGTLWRNAPFFVKQRLTQRVTAEIPAVVQSMVQEIRQKINELLDLKALVVNRLVQDKKLVNEIFLRVGRDEFRFIEKSGFYFGFLFGIPQAIISYFYNPWWLLPLAGLLVGYATNALALKLIFEPLHPKKILGLFEYQGLFIKRQSEVSDEYSAIVTAKIITAESLFDFMLRGPASDKLATILEKHIHDALAETTTGPLVRLVATPAKMSVVKHIATFRYMQELPVVIRRMYGYADATLNLRFLLANKMKSLSPHEFEAFLRPVFQEDETTLIVVGAVLGGIAGVLQYLLLFA